MKYLLFILSLSIYSQAKLVPNVNIDAKELKHNLSIEKDSLLLESDYLIEDITLVKKIEVKAKKWHIPIHDLPQGVYKIMVRTNKKIIVFSIIKQ